MDRPAAPTAPPPPDAARRRPELLTALLLAAFALKLAVALAAVNRGFELGDEGFFLLNLKHPEAAPPPLEGYRVLGRLCRGACDVGVVGARLYRIAAELAGSLALIAGVFVWARARVFPPGAVGFGTFLAWCLLGTLLSVESRSLGYNDLTNLLCFSAVGALFALAAAPSRASARRALLALVAGALAGVQIPVKWPSAVLLSALALPVIAFAVREAAGRERLRLAGAYAAGVAAFAGLMLAALGGPGPVAARLAVAGELIALTEHEPLELLQRYVVLDRWTWTHLGVFVLAFAAAHRLVLRRHPQRRDDALAAALGAAAALLLAATLALHPGFLHPSVLYMTCLAIGLSVALLALSWRAADAASGDRLVLLLVLLALPLAVILGTNVTISMRVPTHGLPFFVLAAVLVLDLRSRIPALRFHAAAAALLLATTAAVFVRHHVVRPYGLPAPIWEQREEVRGLPGVRVDPATRDFLESVSATMAHMGFRPGDPVIAFDYMPGLVYYLGGTSPRYNFYMFRSPAYNCYNLNRAGLPKLPFLILGKPMNVGQLGCLDAIRFPRDFGMPRAVQFPYEQVYEGFGAKGFSRLYLFPPRDVVPPAGR